jgi:hypothetical protein
MKWTMMRLNPLLEASKPVWEARESKCILVLLSFSKLLIRTVYHEVATHHGYNNKLVRFQRCMVFAKSLDNGLVTFAIIL